MGKWVLSANPRFFNHKLAFEKYGYIDWKQTRNYEVGDIVYIYATKPIAKIVYKTKVEIIDMTKEDISDMSQFWVKNEDLEAKRFVRLVLLKTYDGEELSLANLQDHGMRYAPQSPCKVKEELQNYIDKMEAK